MTPNIHEIANEIRSNTEFLTSEDPIKLPKIKALSGILDDFMCIKAYFGLFPRSITSIGINVIDKLPKFAEFASVIHQKGIEISKTIEADWNLKILGFVKLVMSMKDSEEAIEALLSIEPSTNSMFLKQLGSDFSTIIGILRGANRLAQMTPDMFLETLKHVMDFVENKDIDLKPLHEEIAKVLAIAKGISPDNRQIINASVKELLCDFTKCFLMRRHPISINGNQLFTVVMISEYKMREVVDRFKLPLATYLVADF
jgi:hypothetical protein